MSNNRNIRELARTLPPYPKFVSGVPRTIMVTHQYLGERLIKAALEKGVKLEDIKDKKGNLIKPKHKYVIQEEQPMWVNHFEELKKIHEAWSSDKEQLTAHVKAYIYKVMEYNGYQNKEANEKY